MTEAAVSFAGNPTEDPEVRYTDGGTARAMFRVAVLLRALGDFLSTLKAGPAGGRLRRPSSAGRTTAGTKVGMGRTTRVKGGASQLVMTVGLAFSL